MKSDVRRLLPAVLLLALALRALAWQRATMMTSDGPDFLWQAQQMLAGRWDEALAHHYHPLYAALSAGGALLLGEVVAGAVLVSLAAGVATVWAAYALARRALPERPGAAVAAALLAAVHSASVTHTSDVRSDGLHAALFALTAVGLLAALERSGWRWLGAGALAGLAYLTRPEGLFLIAPGALAALACGKSRGARAGGLAALGFAAGLLLVASPYVLAIHGLTGRWMPSMKPSIAAAGLADGAVMQPLPANAPLASPIVRSVSELSRAARDAAVDVDAEVAAEVAAGRAGEAAAQRDAAGAPVATPVAASSAEPVAGPDASAEVEPVGSLGLGHDIRVVAASLCGVARPDILLLAALGFVAVWQRRRGLAWALLVLLGGWLAVAALHHGASGYLDDRHMLGPAQWVLPLAGAGWIALWEAPRLRLVARAGCLVLVAALVLGAIKLRHSDHAARLEGLAFARGRTAPDERLVVHRRKDGWYAQRPVIVLALPCDDRDLLATMARHDASLLVLEEALVRRHAPQWLEGTRFETLARFGEGRGAVVVLRLRE